MNAPSPTPDPGLDPALREALRDAAARDSDPRDTIASLLRDSMRGQSRPLSILMLIVQLALFALAIASVVWFFEAESTRMQVFHAASFLWLMSAMGMIKAWFWMQIHRNRVVREIKRLELQVARLADARAGA